ncbi:MAG: MBL fold metallo-hydrolase [Paludibacteraceae bacterium]|nr:MBL fold metallo-hydrolase [Paludibacteraceae bacterium]
MRITFLVDNLPHPTLPLLTEHGLSMYIDQITPNSSLLTPNSILCDMGASGAYLKNAKALGIDLDTCHWAFLSHGHADHTGGLGKWIAQYGHIHVYASHHIPTLQCYSSRPKKVASQRFNDSAIQPSRSELRYIGPDLNLFHGHTPWFKPIEQNTWISPGIALVHPTCRTYPKPLGNKYLTVVEGQKSKVASQRFNDSAIQRERSENDSFLHEIALCFVTPKGLVIVSCCSHHGALNTIASCMEFTVCNTLHAYIGGLHFVDSEEVIKETTDFINEWLRLYPNAHLYTGHCTCPKAAALLKAHLPKCHTFYTGNVIEV